MADWGRRAASARELYDWGAQLARELTPLDVLLLDGPLGVGKTTLAQGILYGLGIRDVVKSPSYDLVHSYPLGAGRFAYHVDLYRLANPPAPEELDVDADHGVVVVEWGFPWRAFFRSRWDVKLQIGLDDSRYVTVQREGEALP